MQYGNRASAAKFKRKTIDIAFPEIGETFLLREMNGTEQETFETEQLKVEANGNRSVELKQLKPRLIALCWVDETGVRVYADDEVGMLNDDLPGWVILKLFRAAEALNGLGIGAVEDALKNSDSAPASASSSA